MYTEQQMIDANRGYHDGLASRTFTTPIHENWPEGPHYNPDYERGYRVGFIGGDLPHPSDDFGEFLA